MEYSVNNITLQYEATGEKYFGDDIVLMKPENDLTQRTPWSVSGYTIADLLRANRYPTFVKETETLLRRCWSQAGIRFPEDVAIDQYHQHVSGADHLRAVEKTKLLQTTDFPNGIRWIEERISEICGTGLRAQNPFDGQQIFHFRVVRPQHRDNNPLHRDVWLEDYSSCINLYVPVCGSNSLSSLILVPGSHHWKESRIERTRHGAVVNGVQFNVPAVTAIQGDFVVERPNPGQNQVLVFSPYLIHGGAVNLNADRTRISIELRLWKV